MKNFLKVVTCLYSVIAAVSAEEIVFNGENDSQSVIRFEINNQDANTIEITKVRINDTAVTPGEMHDVTLIIPGRTNNKQTVIGSAAFENLSSDYVRLKIKFKSQDNNGVRLPKNCANLFKDSSSITEIDLDGVNKKTAITTTDCMFCNCSNLQTLNNLSFNTSNVTDMKGMFAGCRSLEILKCKFDTSNVVDMSAMFCECSSVTDIEFCGNVNTRRVKTMARMFKGCSSIQKQGGIEWLDTHNVTDMSEMFAKCSSLKKVKLGDAPNKGFNTRSVTNMSGMFAGCSSLTSASFSGVFNPENVTDMSYMFCSCGNLKKVTLGGVLNWLDTRKVTDMSSMFENCTSLAKLSLKHIDMSNVTNKEKMFYGCKQLVNLTLPESFNLASVAPGDLMFNFCPAGDKLGLDSAISKLNPFYKFKKDKVDEKDEKKDKIDVEDEGNEEDEEDEK